MEANRSVREQVIKDIKRAFESCELDVKKWSSGIPALLNVDNDFPAISVSLHQGENIEGLDSTFRSQLMIRILVAASDGLDDELDSYGQVILNVLAPQESDYTAASHLDVCNFVGFDYSRDDSQPWGALDIIFNIEYGCLISY